MPPTIKTEAASQVGRALATLRSIVMSAIPADKHLDAEDFLLLDFVCSTGGALAGKVAEWLHWPDATSTSRVEKLVSRGLLLKSRTTGDKRQVKITALSEGVVEWEGLRRLIGERFIQELGGAKAHSTVICKGILLLADLRNSRDEEASKASEDAPDDNLSLLFEGGSEITATEASDSTSRPLSLTEASNR